MINKEKKYNTRFISAFCVLFLAIMLINCSEDPLHSANGSDGIPPGKVTVNSIENIAGGAIIKFTPPTDEDLLYIKGSYDDENGTQKQVIVSSFIDTLGITGFGQVGQYPVEIRAVDIGDNESEPVTVEISPLEAPIHAILESIEGLEDFGGINISYLNPTRAEVSLNMSVQNSEGELEFKESFYTSQANSSYSFRGYDPEPTIFVIYVEDRWGNQTISRSFEVTPLEDIFLEKVYWSVQSMPGDESFSEYGFSANQIWDGSWSSQWNCGHTSFLPLPHQFTLDLGQTAKLNRFKLYQRGGSELYKHGNPKRFKIYGRENLNSLPIYDPDSPGDGWIDLGYFESFKPSGLPPGSNTAEDYEYQDNGEDFVFAFDARQYDIRYIRLVNLESWNNQMVSVIGELSFWGTVIN
jgi:hypothetical protein